MNDCNHMIEIRVQYVAAKEKKLFPEWVRAKYFNKCDREGSSTGQFAMVFEYDTLEGCHAYKSH